MTRAMLVLLLLAFRCSTAWALRAPPPLDRRADLLRARAAAGVDGASLAPQPPVAVAPVASITVQVSEGEVRRGALDAASVRRAADALRAHGVVALCGGELVRGARAASDEALSLLAALQRQEGDGAVLQSRGDGRFDFRIPDAGDGEDPHAWAARLAAQARQWAAPVVRSVLSDGDGNDAHAVEESLRGCVVALPGATQQNMHADGAGPLFNVFVPLCDLASSNGPTEFVIASHAEEHAVARAPTIEWEPDVALAAPLARAGEVVIFDYRVLHRGGENAGGAPRPIFYVTLGPRGAEDDVNFRPLEERHLAPTGAREEVGRRLASTVSRRGGLGRLFAATAWSRAPMIAGAADDAAAEGYLARRFTALTLTQLQGADDAGGGARNLYFPEWMAGDWVVTQTLRNSAAPLGLAFIGGPRASVAVGEATLAEERRRVGVPVVIRLRFLRTKFGVAEDRLFNNRARLDAFAGRPVVASVEYTDTRDSSRAQTRALGGGDEDPLLTTVTYYRGPAAQKVFSLARRAEAFDGGAGWRSSEASRSIFALTNADTAPPITTDSETLLELRRAGAGVAGRLRLADYLNPTDTLYFDARNRAVAVADYDLLFTRPPATD
ncbi:hypothetical protein M885DRAFT_525498 [Pelagophyceae sp. CCMP2097]|nr:hypothetical protein M885DRAFT_525498 [Pelagophyceae sp. CCMP2097]